jgi:hypothetical protein
VLLALSCTGVRAQTDQASRAGVSARVEPLASEQIGLVHLTIADCAGAAAGSVIKLTELELAPQLAVTLDAARAANVAASLFCTGDDALISVRAAERVDPLVLRLALADTPHEARPRLLALALAELVATSQLERTGPKAPPLAAPVAPPVERLRPLSLWLAGGVLRALEPVRWSPSLSAGSAYARGLLAVSGDLSVEWAALTSERAVVTARSGSLSLAPMLRWRRASLTGSLGLGVRAGMTWLEAKSRVAGVQGRSLAGVFVAPALLGTLGLFVTPRWSVRLALELGYVAKPVRGLDTQMLELLSQAHWRASAQLGLALAI